MFGYCAGSCGAERDSPLGRPNTCEPVGECKKVFLVEWYESVRLCIFIYTYTSKGIVLKKPWYETFTVVQIVKRLTL